MKTAICFAVSFLLMGPPAHSYEAETGAALICDTQRQVERFAQVFDQSLEVAINTVNIEESNPTACAMVDVAYVQGPQMGTARGASHTFKIIPIMVVGANTPNGYRLVEPAPVLMLV